MCNETFPELVSFHKVTEIFTVVLALKLLLKFRFHYCKGECVLHYVSEVLECALACYVCLRYLNFGCHCLFNTIIPNEI